jgi:hypothetical protein
MRLLSIVRVVVAVLVASTVVGNSLSASAEIHPVPGVLVKFLERHGAYRLLTLDDVGDDFKEAFESKAFQFTPLVMADANGDRRPDLVAVLVKPAAQKLYSVVVFHGIGRGFRSEPIWIIQDATEVILGVDVSRLAITPLTCYECDANAVYQWTGRDYEFFLKGDAIMLKPGAEIFAKPDWKSTVVFRAPAAQAGEVSSAQAEILDYGPPFLRRIGPYKRWYAVRVVQPTGPRTGFIGTDFFKTVGP